MTVPAPSPAGPPATPLASAEALGLTVRKRSVWSGLDVDLGAGLAAVSGVSGAGKSTVLLALTGRIGGLTGTLTVAGLDAIARARRVRAVTSVARIASMIDLEGRLTVAESVTERALTDRVPADRAAEQIERLAALTGLGLDRDRLVEDLDAYDRTLLTACLARLRPAVLTVLDDADRDLTVAEQRRLYTALTDLAGDDTAVVVSTREPAALPPGATLVELADPRSTPDTPDTPDTLDTPTPEPRRSR